MHRHRVLVVEDDADSREPIAEVLAQEGFDVEVATDGAEALAQLGSGGRPCVVLLDLRMPGMDGVEFRTEQMRDPALARIPVVMLSGDDLVDEKALELGIQHFIRKPIDVDHLIELIEHTCHA